MGGQRGVPGEGLVDALRAAVGVDGQVLGAAREAEVGAVERLARRHLVVGPRVGGHGLRVGGLEAEAAGGLDAAEEELQEVQGAAGLEAVGVRRDAAHGVHADRAAGHGGVALAAEVGPGAGERDGVVEGGVGELGGEAADGRGVEAAGGGDGLGGEGGVEVGLGHELEDRLGVGRADVVAAGERGLRVRGVGNGAAAGAVPEELAAVAVAQEGAEAGRAGVLVDEPGGVGVAKQVVEVDAAGAHQHVDEAEGEQAVGAGGDADPLVGDGAVAGADRVDGDDAGAAGLELAEADLQRVEVVVLGDAEEQEELRVLPVGGAELPEGGAEGVDAGGGHVDGAEAAVGGVVGGAELLGPPAGEGLGLVAAGEEGELFRVLGVQWREPVHGDAEGLVPGDLAELAGAAGAGAAERRAQAGGAEVLHDAGGALGAEHAAVDRVVAVAVDVFHFAVKEMHVDAAAAGAHVAGGLAHLVGDLRRGVEGVGRGQAGLPGAGAMLQEAGGNDKAGAWGRAALTAVAGVGFA